jgi:glyoxylase-like metal-dependent hydrolase (beta-lactamase superfamily II)
MQLLRLRLPLPFKLAEINAYLVRGRQGVALVDTGLGTPTGERALVEALRQHGLEPQQLRQVFVTHYHGDHWGLAHWLQGLGARVLMPRIDSEFIQSWFARPSYDAEAIAAYGPNGVPEETAKRVARAMAQMRAMSPRFVADEQVEDGQHVELAGESFEVIITPGHTPGHACLLHSSSQPPTLLVGDHVLPHITPNISVDLGTIADPLSAYRASLRRVRGRHVGVAYPAHGEPIRDLDGRIDEILRHHDEREQRVLELLADDARSCFEIAVSLFELPSLDAWETWLALGETLAHLRALQTAGVVAEGEPGMWRRVWRGTDLARGRGRGGGEGQGA